MAAGRPILMTYSVGHSVIRKYQCGLELDEQTPETIADAIIKMCDLPVEQYKEYCNNATECSHMYDYKLLCDQLVKVINKCI